MKTEPLQGMFAARPAPLPRNSAKAKGHLAASAVFSMALHPHILHVVGYSEASRVVDPPTLIESCRIARGAVRLCLLGAPESGLDPAVVRRRDHLVAEARVLLEAIRRLEPACPEPWAEPSLLTAAIRRGLLDGMLHRIRHRGPDGVGVLPAGRTSLGHRRLAILDLPGGAQPMRR